MRALALASVVRPWIPVLVSLLAVTGMSLLLLLIPADAEAQAGRDLTVNISKAGALAEVPSGTNVAFVVTVANIRAGQVDTDVVTRVTMPNGFTSLSTEPAPATGFACTTAGSLVQCTLPSLGGNTQKTFRISATAPSTISGASQAFTLTAQVDPNNLVAEGPTGNGNNSDNFTLNVVTQAELNLSLAGAPGQDFTKQLAPNLAYVVTAKNDGDRDATNVLVRSTLPKDVDFVKVEENTLGNCLQNSTASNGARNVNCTVSSVPAHANRHVRIIAKTVGSVPDGAQVTFAVNADPNNSVAERNETNNTAFMVTTLRAPSDLQVTGIAVQSDDALILTGATAKVFELRLTVNNNGPYASRATTIRTAWPAGIIAHPDRAGHPCFDSCPVPQVNPGQSIQVTMTGIMRGPFEALLTHPARTVQVTSTADPNQTLLETVVGNNKVTLAISLPTPILFAR